MAGNKIGGLKAAAKNKELYGNSFYADIGRKGGKNGTTGGFAADVMCDEQNCAYKVVSQSHLIRNCAGFKGGKVSRRGKTVKPTVEVRENFVQKIGRVFKGKS